MDLEGRCVLPGFTDSHVHFPTWSLSQHDVQLEGVEGLAGALERVRTQPRRGDWIRGTGWRDAEWAEQPTKQALDEVTGDTPALLWSKDYHSAWLNSAALTRAGGDLDVDGGVVERDGAGEPTGVLREESAWRFRARFAMPGEDEFVEATREGLRLAASRGVVAIHDKDGWLGAPGSSSASPHMRGSRCACGSRFPTSGCRNSKLSASTRASATASCGSAT